MKRSKPSKKLSQAILQIRTDLNLNQRDMADKLGTSAMAVSRWEAGVNEPDGKSLVALAKLTKKPDIYWLLLGALGLTKRDLRG